MQPNYKIRRLVILLVIAIVSLSGVALDMTMRELTVEPLGADHLAPNGQATSPASKVLQELLVKGKAAKTNYARTQFSNGWAAMGECDMRNIILRRDLDNVRVDDECKVTSGSLDDPYTGKVIAFVRGAGTSADVQIDHVVALSNAWQTGAQQLSVEQRHAFANDPLNLLAADGKANQQKSDGDAATWLPSNKAFRCQYVARQIAVKRAYSLWITSAEHAAMSDVLQRCPDQAMPVQ